MRDTSLMLSGRRLRLLARGLLPSGPALLLPGAGLTAEVWRPVISLLPASAPVAALDPPGHGRSDGPACQTIEELAGLVVSVIDATGGGPVVLGGHSMGGAVALSVALSRAEKVSGLFLVASGARLRLGPVLRQAIETAPAAFMDLVLWFARSGAWRPDVAKRVAEDIAGTGPETLASDLKACHGFDVLDRLGDLACPIRVVGGTRDRLTPLRLSRAIAARAPDADLTVVPGGTHMVMLERPEQVAAALAPMLETGNK